jgi:hypothetical protein
MKSSMICGWAMALLLAASCGGGGEGTCRYGGKTYKVGATFDDTDGCNICECRADGVACTLMACAGDAGFSPPDALPDSAAAPTCTYNGKTYPYGVSFLSTDGCNTCWCGGSNGVVCTLAGCSRDANLREAATSCPWEDASLSIGQTFTDPIRCADCTCQGNGVVGCASRTCPPGSPDAPASCTLPARLVFGHNGGMVSFEDENVLDPQAGLRITRSYRARSNVDGAAVRACTPPLPVCGAAGVVSVATIVADLAAADVQAAFAAGATTAVYGVDLRPVDGTVYAITLGSSGTILVGNPCSQAGGLSCTPIPPGIQRLADDLKSLAYAAVATEDCKGL